MSFVDPMTINEDRVIDFVFDKTQAALLSINIDHRIGVSYRYRDLSDRLDMKMSGKRYDSRQHHATGAHDNSLLSNSH